MVGEYYHKCVYVVTEWKLKKKIFFFFLGGGGFLSQIWEKHLIFALGIGAEFGPKIGLGKSLYIDQQLRTFSFWYLVYESLV